MNRMINILGMICIVLLLAGCGGGGSGSGGSFSGGGESNSLITVSPTVASPTVTPTVGPITSPTPTSTSWLTRYDGKSYHIEEKIEVSYVEGLKKVAIALPIPQTNQYQDVNSAMNINADGWSYSYNTIAKTGDVYIGFLNPTISSSSSVTMAYDITLYGIKIDFSRIGATYPYDQSSNIFINNTQTEETSKGKYIDPSHNEILSISNSLWNQSGNDYINYAKLCYGWVASHDNFTYGLPNQGLRTIDDLMSSRIGDCGNMSSIFISLMRAKKIPSRHVVMIRPKSTDGHHVYAEFYLEKYGWVPVDVSYKSIDPNNDYFGNVNTARGIVVTTGCVLEINGGLATSTVPILQDYALWCVGSQPSATFTSTTK